MTASSPNLVAQNEGPKPLAGAGLLDSGASAWGDIGKAMNGEGDWFSLAVDGISVGLDLLGMALDPLGEVVKAGVGWLMEHISFIREPLEMLTGDPGAITAVSKTWQNIAQQLTKTAANYGEAINGIQAWAGETAQKYRTAATDYANGLNALAAHADDVGQGVAIAGMVVATERAIVFDMIASFISRIITEAIVAAAAAAPSFGASMGAFFTSLSVDLTMTMANITKRFSKLLTVIKRFVKKFDSLGETGKKVAKTLGDKSQSMHNWADRLTKTRPQRLKINGINALKNGSPLAKFHKPIGNFGDTPAAINDSYAQKTAKEGLKAGNDGKEDAGGGSEKPK